VTARSPDPRSQRDRWQRSLGPRISAASLVLIGLAIGFAASLYFAWIVEPVSYTEASPARMSDRYRAEYILLVSQSFEAGGDWQIAQERLEALADDRISQTVGDQLAEYLRQGESAERMRSLALLARQLGVESAAVDVFVPPDPERRVEPAPGPTSAATLPARPAENQPAEVSTAQPSPTPTPTATPSPTAVPVYRLLSRELACQPDVPVQRLEIITVDSSLEPLPAAEIIVIWEEGNDHFFTGFQPERGVGYGDFEMEPGVDYTVMMAEGSQLVTGLSVVLCEEALGGLPGGWRLTFQNTDVQQ
jgi:hypothetical protein